MKLLPKTGLAVAAFSAFVATQAAAQTRQPESVEFAGGKLTITETADLDKVLAFDGQELARDFVVMFDRVAPIGDTEVAFFRVGPGGNACAPATIMVWKPEGGDITATTGGDGCTTPPPALTDYDVLFVPYLMPGDAADVRIWNPEAGFRLHGRLSFVPQPDTSWGNFDPDAVGHPIELFGNADIYAAAQALVGDALGSVTTGLNTAGRPEVTAGGLLSARGCVPHACGVSDTFVVVDKTAKAIFLAQQGEKTRYWPARSAWPAQAAALIPSDF